MLCKIENWMWDVLKNEYVKKKKKKKKKGGSYAKIDKKIK